MENLYKDFLQDELAFSEVMMNVFSQEVYLKFGTNVTKEVDFKDVVHFEIGDKQDDNSYVMLGCRYRPDKGEVIFNGRLYSEGGCILKRKRIAVSENTFSYIDDNSHIRYNMDCDNEIKTLVGAYLDIIYTTLFL